MARELDQDELIERWTLIGNDLERVASKRSAAKLGFALLLKFFAAHGRFPRGRSELPHARRIQTEHEQPPRLRPHQSVSGSACVRAGGFSIGGVGAPGR